MKDRIGRYKHPQFFGYVTLAAPFSLRKLTYELDAFMAFAGIISALEEAYGWKFASALPEVFFDLAILWHRREGDHRPRTGTSSTMGERSPTWCWTAWTGAISWNSWVLGQYAEKYISINSKVPAFLLKLNGVTYREIVPEGSDVSRSRASAEAHTIAGREDTPVNALVFDAETLPVRLLRCHVRRQTPPRPPSGPRPSCISVLFLIQLVCGCLTPRAIIVALWMV